MSVPAALQTEVARLFGTVITAHAAYYKHGGPEKAVHRAIRALCTKLDAIIGATMGHSKDVKNAERAAIDERGQEILDEGEQDDDVEEAGKGVKEFWSGYERYVEGIHKARERKVGALQMLEAKRDICNLLARGFGGAKIFKNDAAAAAGPAPPAIRAPSFRATPSKALVNSAAKRLRGDETPPWGYEMTDEMHEKMMKEYPGAYNNNAESVRTLNANDEESNNNSNNNGHKTPVGQTIRHRNSPPAGPPRGRRPPAGSPPSTPTGQPIRQKNASAPNRRGKTRRRRPNSPARAGEKRTRNNRG